MDDNFKIAKWHELSQTKKQLIILLIAILILFIGLLLGYNLGFNVSQTYYLEEIARLKDKCIILN